MHRGKPLYLNEERYAALTYMVKKETLSLSLSLSKFKNPHFRLGKNLLCRFISMTFPIMVQVSSIKT